MGQSDTGQITVAVLMTLHRGDDIALFELAMRSIETQRCDGVLTRIYLCVDGALRRRQRRWLVAHHARFHHIARHARAQGLAASLNRLINALGQERYVFRMDGDDISHPDRFATQIRYLEAHPDIALVGCQAMDIDGTGQPLAPRDYPSSHGQCRRALTRLNPVLHPTFCIRREVLRDPALRYPEAYLTEDLAFLVRLSAKRHAIANIPERLFFWRVTPSFFRRRHSLRRALVEMKWYAIAVYTQEGLLSRNYVYALARVMLRTSPVPVQKLIYASSLRAKILSMT